MNIMNKMLMIPVERIVRPMTASLDHKMRMREELYSHLEQIYLEELETTQDETAALENAIARLGEQEIITNDLQRTISKKELSVIRYNQLFLRKPAESRFRFAAKMGLAFALIEISLFVGSAALGDLLMPEKNFLAIVPLLIVNGLLMGWNAFFGLFNSQYFIEPEGILLKRNKGLSFAGFRFGISMAVSVVAMWASIPGGIEVTRRSVLPATIAFFAGWGVFCLVVWLLRFEREQTLP